MALTKISILEGEVPAPDQLKGLYQANRALLQKTIKKLADNHPRELDRLVHSLHEEAFRFYDCLSCANCCRSISPAISHNDVEQLSKKIKIRPSEVVVKYLRMDEDGDYVFNVAPCPFIDGENFCSVYSHRPKACREYPHTDRSRFYQLLKLSLKNAEICPVVYAILMKMG
ncbi:MAG: YkgJ family cysteine cluster protein [Bacteroidota bacterium]